MSLSVTVTDVLLAGGALILTLGVGIVAHEFSHALVLRSLGVPFDVTWLPDRDGAGSMSAVRPLAPRTLPRIPVGSPSRRARSSSPSRWR